MESLSRFFTEITRHTYVTTDNSNSRISGVIIRQGKPAVGKGGTPSPYKNSVSEWMDKINLHAAVSQRGEVYTDGNIG